MSGREVDWRPVAPPPGAELRGRYVTLRPVRSEDAESLFEAGRDPAIWTYLPYGPYDSLTAFEQRVAEMVGSTDPLYMAVCVDGVPQGIVSLMRIDTAHGVIETGHIWFGTPLQRTRAATESLYLLGRHVFDELGYRRFEWKCNALNEKSRRAAERFGFTFEGVFRNHMVVKGRNRDTAWYSITGEEWPGVKAGFEAWLRPENFDAAGRQMLSMRSATDSTIRDGRNG